MEYWCHRRLTITTTGPQGRQQVTLQQPFARIGSHADSEIVLAGTEKRSLYVHATDEGVFCLNVSEHGNPGSDQAVQWLAPGSVLTLGAYSLSATLDPAPSANNSKQTSLITRGTVERPLPAFRIVCKSGPKARYKLSRALTIVGRNAANGLNLSGSLVSSPHCVLYCQSGRVWCIDLLSGNGSLVNGKRCVCAELLPTDRLQVGEFRLIYASRTPPSLLTSHSTNSNIGATAELAPASNGPEAEQRAAFLDDTVDQSGTVRLGRGDTVTVPQADPALTDDVVAATPGSESTFHQLPGTGGLTTPVDSAGGATTGPIDRAADQAALPSDDLSRQMHKLLRQIEEQNATLTELRQAVTTGQQQWHAEREALQDQLKQQAFHIDRLQAELANANTLLEEVGLQKDAEAERPPSRGEKVSDARHDSAAASNAPNACGRTDSAPVKAIGVSRPIPDGASLGLSRQAQRIVNDEVTGQERPNAKNIATAVATSLDEGLPDVADADAAQRETIGSVESVLSTVVWQALRANAAAATQQSSPPAATNSPAPCDVGQDQFSGPMVGSNDGQNALPDDAGAQLDGAAAIEPRQNKSRWQTLLIGGMVALAITSLAAACVAGLWIWGR